MFKIKMCLKIAHYKFIVIIKHVSMMHKSFVGYIINY